MVQFHPTFVFSKFPRFHSCVAILDVQLIAKKSISKAYPKALLTFGDHIRKRQLDLNLHQIDVANILRVDEMTIVGWELNHCAPLARHIPRIIDFLGYVAEDLFSATTLGQKIKRYRLLHGKTRSQLAERMHVDESTLWRMENEKGKFFRATLEKLAPFLHLLGSLSMTGTLHA
jgi:transcriptional regulator with XRE-family HTH domain